MSVVKARTDIRIRCAFATTPLDWLLTPAPPQAAAGRGTSPNAPRATPNIAPLALALTRPRSLRYHELATTSSLPPVQQRQPRGRGRHTQCKHGDGQAAYGEVVAFPHEGGRL